MKSLILLVIYSQFFYSSGFVIFSNSIKLNQLSYPLSAWNRPIPRKKPMKFSHFVGMCRGDAETLLTYNFQSPLNYVDALEIQKSLQAERIEAKSSKVLYCEDQPSSFDFGSRNRKPLPCQMF